MWKLMKSSGLRTYFMLKWLGSYTLSSVGSRLRQNWSGGHAPNLPKWACLLCFITYTALASEYIATVQPDYINLTATAVQFGDLFSNTPTVVSLVHMCTHTHTHTHTQSHTNTRTISQIHTHTHTHAHTHTHTHTHTFTYRHAHTLLISP